jgi:glycosyltransferase involved in cell wall biosynthesis
VYDIERAGMEAADRVIAVSHYTKDRIVNRYGIPEQKVRVVHNAVSKEKTIERLHIEKNFNEKIVLFLGRITFQKGPEYFIDAAKKVIDKIPNVRFVMAGSGDMFPRMVEMAARMRIGSHFHFTGFLKGQEVEKMYAMSDLYVMPSVSEPFGIAPLEAILYDIPIIVSKQSGVAEVLDHAVKLDFWDTEKLADNIISLLTHPELAEEMVARNREQLSQIKWEIAAEKTIAVYNELTGGN